MSRAQEYARLRDQQFSLFEHYARQNGMTSKTMFILMWIYYTPQGITQDTIAKRSFSTKQVVQATVKKYLSKGWLSLVSCKEDKRKKFVTLTDLGQKECATLFNRLAGFEEKAMAQLTEDEQETLLKATAVFSKSLEDLVLGLEGAEDDI